MSLTLPPSAKIYLSLAPCDMRKGFDGLSAQVRNILQLDPFSGAVFLFRGKRGDRLKALVWDGSGLCLYAKRLERGKFVWPRTQGAAAARLSAAQLAMLIEGLDWVRRETGRRQRVKVPYDEGVANHIAPESCVDGREAILEALTGAHIGQPLSDERLPIQSAHALQSAEGNTNRCDFASTGRLCVVGRPWHVCTSSAREPGDLRTALTSRVQGLMGKAEGQSR